MALQVFTRHNHYAVIDWNKDGVTSYSVFKGGDCACGGTYERPCPHVEEVKKYLENGGRRANGILNRRIPPQAPGRCPVCNGEVVLVDGYRCRSVRWACKQNPAHFWLAYGDGAVKAFLTRPHPNKMGAFYTHGPLIEEGPQTDREMEAYFRR